ncbi:hypothetical protein LTR64_003955 [Lithohypha guttulata]|uniref:uncharacterized protein n=1 Tax=Lithohypha guttulata TaxID=1690604 RepID=UPI002DDF7FA7|nr:hypothetical protein LTR51_006993 [Lithohypha guttulata]
MASFQCFEVSPQCPVEYSIYGYYPSLPANAFLTAWFAVLFIPNIIFGIYYKTWTYMLALGFGCAIEALGYGGRIMLHQNPFSSSGFQMQICCLILGPAFNSAAIYLTMKHIALAFGPEYSSLKPKWYTWIFITGDLFSLVLQAIGGGMAATADDDDARRDAGTYIMLAGICWQVVTLIVFAAVIGHYIIRRRRAINSGHALSAEANAVWHDKKFRLFMFAVATAFGAVLIRCIYRIPELAAGWASEIMRDEPSYIALEGCMIAYATLVQTVFHPGYCFPQLAGRHRKAGATAATEEKGVATPESN